MSRISSPPKNVLFIFQIILTRAHFVVLKEKPSYCKDKQRRNDGARAPHLRADHYSVTPTLLENKNKPGRDGDHANLLHTQTCARSTSGHSAFTTTRRGTFLWCEISWCIWYVNILTYTFRLWNCSSQSNWSVERQCHLRMPLINYS